MKSRDPKTGITFDLNIDSQFLEWIQEELAETPAAQMERIQIVRAVVRVHAEQVCPIGDTALDRAYLELVVAHFLGWSFCAWCGERLGLKKGMDGISHGVCEDCAAKANAEVRATLGSEFGDEAE